MDYIDGKESNSSTKVNISQNVDVEAIANAVVKALSFGKINLGSGFVNNVQDDFNDENSLKKLADAMVVQRSKNEVNFDHLGDTKINQRDVNEINKSIDILKDIND